MLFPSAFLFSTFAQTSSFNFSPNIDFEFEKYLIIITCSVQSLQSVVFKEVLLSSLAYYICLLAYVCIISALLISIFGLRK